MQLIVSAEQGTLRTLMEGRSVLSNSLNNAGRPFKARVRLAETMARKSPAGEKKAIDPPAPAPPEVDGLELPMVGGATSQFAELSRPLVEEKVAVPQKVARGVVAFDLDGTILDDIGLISHLAGDVLFQAFGTPPEEARVHYLATTGMPFEAQLSQLYPDVAPAERRTTARTFHQRKVAEAYATAKPFPEIPRVLRQLSQANWTLVISTGAEREMADLMLEREGLRYWFEGVLGSGQGTKREHLTEYRRRYPEVPMFLVGDSRFDMEAASSTEGVQALGRASRLHDWTLSPDDLTRWGAIWADYSLSELPDVLERLANPKPTAPETARRGTRSPPRKR